MVRIRLAKYGRKNAPAYRIVAADRRQKRDGKFLEQLGSYNPTENSTKINIDKERYEYWLSVGAQPSEAIIKLIKGKYDYKPYNPNQKEVQETVAVEDESKKGDKPE